MRDLSVRIFGIPYSIEFVDGDDKDMRGVQGLCIPAEATIKISTDSPENVQRSTVLHEILHAVAGQIFGSDGERSLLEEHVRALEAGLFAALNEEEIAAWIFFGWESIGKKGVRK